MELLSAERARWEAIPRAVTAVTALRFFVVSERSFRSRLDTNREVERRCCVRRRDAWRHHTVIRR